jgi:electron transfer flavoprotein beta subunit
LLPLQWHPPRTAYKDGESEPLLRRSIVMKIAVCLKQVPARDSVLRLNSEGKWIQETDLSFEINEPDIYALEEGLRLKEKHGGEVLICCLGPARAQQAIKEALAKGADRALHLDDPAFEGLDPYALAQALARALEKENPDLVLTGLQSDDDGLAQTGVLVAELLGLPHSTIIMEIQVEGKTLRVKRELEGGWFQWIELPLPALLTIQSGINKPRYATLKGIMAAKNKPIQKLSPADLGLSREDLAPHQRITKVYVPVKSGQTEFLQGTPKEVAARLVDKLKNEARVI